MKAAAIIQSYAQNIFRFASVSGTAPRTTYSLDTLLMLRPDMRVCWDTGTVSLVFDVGSVLGGSPAVPQQGDILVIPVSNIGSGVATLTNDAGLMQTIEPPMDQANGLPRTIVIDLSIDTPDPTDRTAATWTLTIAGNPDNLTLGGAIAIYGPKTYLVDRDFQWGYAEKATHGAVDAQNEYLTLYRQPTLTVIRSIDLTALATDSDAALLRAWFDGNFGHGRPGLLWFDPDIQDAYLGYWSPEFGQQKLFDDANLIALSFAEMSKGVPLL